MKINWMEKDLRQATGRTWRAVPTDSGPLFRTPIAPEVYLYVRATSTTVWCGPADIVNGGFSLPEINLQRLVHQVEASMSCYLTHLQLKLDTACALLATQEFLNEQSFKKDKQ